MRIPFRSLAVSAVAVAALLATAVHAQVRSVRPVAPSPAPSAAARAAQAAPNPAGLRGAFPAGVSSGSGAAVSTNPIAASTATTQPSAVSEVSRNPNVTDTENDLLGENSPDDTTTPDANTAALGGGAPGYGVARGPGRGPTLGGSGYSAVEIARAFIHADGNKDGDLTRAEAQRLNLSLMSFEEMDRNFDGIISRAEYEDGMR